MSTPSDDDKLYITEDLEGRLDPASLEAAAAEPADDFYKANSLVWPVESPKLPDPVKVSVCVVFETAESVVLDGSLQTLSFGPDGWLCGLNTEHVAGVLSIASNATKQGVLHVIVKLPDNQFELHKNVDCTASFSYGSASFTVTSDEARYV